MTPEITTPSSFDDDSLDKAFAQVVEQANSEARSLASPDAVEEFRLRWLGRKQGRLNDVSAWLKAAPPQAKKSVGERFKVLKDLVESLLEKAASGGPSESALAAEAIDITLPGSRRLTGAEHPITRTWNDCFRSGASNVRPITAENPLQLSVSASITQSNWMGKGQEVLP